TTDDEQIYEIVFVKMVILPMTMARAPARA
ncbi:3-isopropylmalate dehydrogenase, partial [Burkholderia pseudomallei]